MSRIIEDKIPIAADAAETLNSFLEELVVKLQKKGSKNTYAMVSEVENMIIAKLKEKGKTTKLTLTDLMDVIGEIGTPDDIIGDFIDPDQEFHVIDHDLVPANTSRSLKKRHKSRDVDDSGFGLLDIIRSLLASIPSALMLVILVFGVIDQALLNSWGNIEDSDIVENAIDNIETYFIFFIIGISLYIVKELVSGFSGQTLLNYANTKKLRYFERGVYLSGFAFLYIVHGLFRRTDFIASNPRYLNQITDFTIAIFFLILGAELFTFVRDHLYGLHPLEPSFRPFVRFLAPSYLLTIASFILVFLLGFMRYDVDYILFFASVVSTLAIIYSTIRNTNVTIRYYLLNYLVLISLTMQGNDAALYGLIMIALVIISQSIFKFKRNGKTAWTQSWREFNSPRR